MYDVQTRQITDIIVDEGNITSYNSEFVGGFTGTMEMLLKSAQAMDLGLMALFNYINANQIQITMNAELLQVLKDKAFGQEIMNEFLSMRKATPSTAEEDLGLMDYAALGDVRELLYDGSIKSARTRLLDKPDTVIPAETRTYFGNKMAQYLGI